MTRFHSRKRVISFFFYEHKMNLVINEIRWLPCTYPWLVLRHTQICLSDGVLLKQHSGFWTLRCSRDPEGPHATTGEKKTSNITFAPLSGWVMIATYHRGVYFFYFFLISLLFQHSNFRGLFGFKCINSLLKGIGVIKEGIALITCRMANPSPCNLATSPVH